MIIRAEWPGVAYRSNRSQKLPVPFLMLRGMAPCIVAMVHPQVRKGLPTWTVAPALAALTARPAAPAELAGILPKTIA